MARPVSERAAFLAEACADDASLRLEVESLVARAESAPSFLETPVVAVASPSLIGRRLGAYRIDALIGAGGMGEVYRAKDTRLGRDVAVKVLPSDWAADPQRRNRFEREARAIAALNHPNICTIHDVGHDQGIDFLVMEVIDGESLAARLLKGPLPFDQAVARAIEIADALDKAHRQGIIHRDLKPGNVMLAKTGSGKSHATQAKLLDFGLARVVSSEIGSGAAALTDAVSMTEAGAMLGTLQYMAPEQIEGQPADARTDIFAFGALLYEMLTGRRAFEGESPASVAAAILTHNPPPLSLFQPLATPQLDHVVARCLEKQPDGRWQTARDVSSELAFAAMLARVAPPEPPALRTRRWIWAVGAIALATCLLTVGFLRWLPRQPAAEAVPQRVQFSIPAPESVRAISGLSVSADGSRVSFVGAGQLWIHEIATSTTYAVRGIKIDAQAFPFWSPDGQFIAYFQDRQLMKIPAGGGIARRICDVTAGRGGSWGADDTIIFAQSMDSIYRVPAGGGVPIRVTTLDRDRSERAHFWPHFLPDGRHFTYVAWGTPPVMVYIASLDPHKPRRAVASLESEAYVGGGFILTAADLTLQAQRLDSSGLLPVGESLPLARDIAWPPGSFIAARSFAASPEALVYSVSQRRRFQFSSVDRTGRQLGAHGPAAFISDGWWSIAPDGARLAFEQWESEGGARQVWLLELPAGRMVRFTSDLGGARGPVWAGSSDQIVFTRSDRLGKLDPRIRGQDLHLKRVGGDVEEQIGESSGSLKLAWDWHPNGRTLLFGMQVPPRAVHNFWLLERGSQKPVHWLRSDFIHGNGQFSPDGRWVAYESNESGAFEVYVRRFPSADGQRQISTGGGASPRWRKDGKVLFYVHEGTLMEVDLEFRKSIKAGVPRTLFKLEESQRYAVLPDGKGFMLCRPVDPVTPPKITVVLNWTVGLDSR